MSTDLCKCGRDSQYGCGCNDPPDAQPSPVLSASEKTLALARELEAEANALEAKHYGHLTPDEIRQTRPCMVANLHRNFADRLRLLAGKLPPELCR